MRPSLHNTICDREFLRQVRLVEFVREPEPQFLVRCNGRSYVLGRHGACRTPECGAACCRLLCLAGPMTRYLAGFAREGLEGPVLDRPCDYLGDDLLCARWGREDFPPACRDFPVPGDALFLEVMDVCGFGFHLLEDATARLETRPYVSGA